MGLVVVVMREKKQDKEDLVVVVDRGDKAVMALDIEDGDGLPTGHFDLVRRWQDSPQIDQALKSSAMDKLLPMIKRGGNGRMELGIVA